MMMKTKRKVNRKRKANDDEKKLKRVVNITFKHSM